MKNFSTTLLLIAILVSSNTYGQYEIGGVTLPNTLSIKGNTLIFNGGSIREKFWIDLYVGGLYLSLKESNAQKIIDANENMAIYLCIASNLITSEKMIEAVDEGFKKSTKGNVKNLENDIETFKGALKEPIQYKDTYIFAYSSEEVSISKNGKHITSIQGLAFKKALFGIWLGDEPADEGFKQGMLGLN